jgi:DNA-binding HxlR family transcriptional regulator
MVVTMTMTLPKAKRAYTQYCGIARALNIVGERWTLLLVRELLAGPKRFKDLLDGLDGIGPNLLAQRLKELEADGLLRRALLPPPAGVAVYELTEIGQGLEPVLIALGRWGFQWLSEPCGANQFNPAWAALALKILFEAERARGVYETYEFRIGTDAIHAIVDDGRIEVAEGPARRPAAACAFITDADTFGAIGARELTVHDAIASGRARVEGDPTAWERCEAIFPIPERGPVTVG